jgi:hypothetical protein
MKKFGIIIFIVAVLIGVAFSNLFSFGRVSGKLFNFSFGTSTKGSGVASSEVREARDFKGVEVGGIFEVEIRAGKDFSVQVEADDNLIQYVRTEVRGGVLRIETTKRISSQTPLRIVVSAPDIEMVDVSGVSKVSVTGISNPALRLETSGASKVSISGETAVFTVGVSGASRIDADGLKTKDATIKASGASHVNVAASERLVANASGASKIGYTGSPARVEEDTSGASKIYKK